MDEIPQNELESMKGSEEEWKKKVAAYPSLEKLDANQSDYKLSHDGREERLVQFIKNHPNLDSMKDNPNRILEAMDEYASQHEFLIHIGSSKGKVITGLILENKPRVLVELGGYVGYSAILFAEQMRAQASEARPVHVWSIEQDPQIAIFARDLISLAGLQDYVTVVSGAVGETLRKLHEEGKIEAIDFLFLDHSEDLYEQDLKLALDELKLMRANACIVADNILRPGAPKYREYVRSHGGLRTRSLKTLILPGEFEDELEISKVLGAVDSANEQETGKPASSIV